MLDPYIRTNLTAAPTTSAKRAATTFVAEFQLPDVFGVYTLMVRYQRPGYTWIEQRDVVPVRPYHHDEYPRFLSIAYPYYTGAASVMLGFLVFCAVWLYTPQQNTNAKSSSSTTTTTTSTTITESKSSSKSSSSTRKSK
jgi:oligosaccharyltransferase complex subunit beta